MRRQHFKLRGNENTVAVFPRVHVEFSGRIGQLLIV